MSSHLASSFCIKSITTKFNLPTKETNTRLPFHFDKQAKSFLNNRTFSTKAGDFQSLPQESVIDFYAGSHAGPRLLLRNKPYTSAKEKYRNGLLQNDERWHAAAAPHLPERPFRAWPSGSLLEFLQLRSFDRSTSVNSSFPSLRALSMKASTATADTPLR